jgi:hypothetical protein
MNLVSSKDKKAQQVIKTIKAALLKVPQMHVA